MKLIDADKLPRTQVVERETFSKGGRLGMRHVITEVIRVEDLENAPAVDAEPVVHGYCDWCKPDEELCGTCKSFFDYYGDGGSDKCSAECESHKCDAYQPIRFCPNCGAKMDGGNEDG